MKNKTTIWVFAIAIIAIMSLTACKPQQELTIGVIGPLSGPAAFTGSNLQEGALLAERQLEEQGFEVNLIFEDSIGDTAKAVTGFQKLSTTEQPDAYIIATGAEAIAPLAEENKVPIIATITSASGIPQMGEYTFRYFTYADSDAPIVAEYAIDELKLETFAVLFTETAYGFSYDSAFTTSVETNGGEVLIHESFPFANHDFRTSLLKIADKHPDAIYIVGLDFEILTALGQIKELDFPDDITVLAVGTITDENAIAQGGPLVDNIYSSAFCTHLPKEYILAFQNEYGKLPGYFSLFGYDSVKMLAIASGGEDIRDSLSNLGTYHGLIGKVEIDKDGEMEFDMCPVQIRGSDLWNLKTGEKFLFPKDLI